MKLESVLDLQDQLLRGLGPGPRLAAQSAREAAPARRARDVSAVQRDFALGIAPKGAGDYELAIRVQRRGLLTGARLDSFIEAAHGEAQVRYIGRVEKLQAPQRDRHRPLVPGVSVGHEDITAGTLGCFVQTDAGLAILSNNHVLADENRAAIGDPIIQPADSDGGAPPEDLVARLTEYVPLQIAGVNRVDAAVAALEDGVDVIAGALLGGQALRDELVAPRDALDLGVVKVGRTTGRTAGRVTAFNVRKVVVEYDTSASMRFDGQIEVQDRAGTDFSLGGDSGALIVTADEGRPVGLLFAGSDQGGDDGGPVTYANPIGSVLDELNATLYLGV